MKTSNVQLLAEIDTLEEIKRVDANDLEVVKRIEELEKTVRSCKLTFETMRGETGFQLDNLVCWQLINKVI